MEWIYSTSDPILETLILCILILVMIIIVSRIIGLTSFSRMTSYDFAFTVAVGSLIATILTSSTSFVHGTVAIFGLLILTLITSKLQRKFNFLNKAVANDPILLMDGNKILHENLEHEGIHINHLMAKLREANVMNLDQVRAVVLETTGEVTVLHKSSADSNEPFDEILLRDVKRKV
ncbi:DUF421 domain-containing protein [Mangrovivirga sp. M17]|uniref:DUF421 domain-containing protein n=1 Tax=Mangrovivirga halotolerans TaxID=2993936 RepID=A0ABT3RWS3_9BACT|nr:YetF domain-containing protein [Mangrovivirga halotolerans]MCX2745600.1 DUF421 domain-containing protein [Mangrovivirga halotolerans]